MPYLVSAQSIRQVSPQPCAPGNPGDPHSNSSTATIAAPMSSLFRSIETASSAHLYVAVLAPLEEFFSTVLAERRSLFLMALAFLLAGLDIVPVDPGGCSGDRPHPAFRARRHRGTQLPHPGNRRPRPLGIHNAQGGRNFFQLCAQATGDSNWSKPALGSASAESGAR